MKNQTAGTQKFAFAFPLLAVLIWSGNTVVAKLAATAVQPGAISFYRWLVAGILMTPFLGRHTWANRQIVRQHLGKLALLALLGMVIYQGFAYLAGKTTTATNMGVIIAIMPLVSAILNAAVNEEAITSGVFVGGLLSIGGIVFLISHGHPANLLDNGIRFGDGLMLAATVSYAAYGVLLKRWAIPLPTWQSLYAQVGFAIVFLLPWFVLSPSSPVTAGNTSLILYAALPASILAPYLWMNGVRLIGPGRASLYMNLLPIFVALVAMLMLGEPLHSYHLIGGAATLVGVWLGQTATRPLIRAKGVQPR
ncbi:DMT family transporter [Paraburkholderia dipogonis]|uniref:DMT family transporter n=1 Tax=Paraburkholderia dipogonis TaxID=1211383 RepID=A0A4Y8MP51_9BURK|nr:DMT family transporter [Paraburkholderia dipogonis]TFE39182.1 DMT family transporter [Paraburkholderia dipogonis]